MPISILVPILLFSINSNETPWRGVLNAKIDQVYYDNISGTHIYKDLGLEELVTETAAKLVNPRTQLRLLELFRELSQEERNKLLKDTNTEYPESRIEALDLIAEKILHRVKAIRPERKVEADLADQFSISDTRMRRLIRTALKRFLGDESSNEEIVEIFQVPVGAPQNRLLVFAAGPLSFIKQKGVQRVLELMPNNDLISASIVEFNHKETDLGFHIGIRDQFYEVTSQVTRVRQPLPLPQIRTIKEPIRAVATYGLTDSLSADLLSFFFKYLEMQGYKLISQANYNDLLAEFSAAFHESRVFIPIAHQIDLSKLVLGQKSGQKVVFRKGDDQSGKESTIELTLFLPLEKASESGSQTLSYQDLARLFSERRKNQASSLTVLQLSCRNEHAVEGWMSAYRHSLDRCKLGEFPKDVPFIVTTDRGFLTDEPYEKLEALEYVILVLDSMSQGADYSEVQDILKKTSSITQKLLDEEGEENPDAQRPRSFQPVCNTDPRFESLFKAGATIEFILQKKASAP